jgi:serine/threonine protein kinase
MNDIYKNKYLKYKQKYKLLKQAGGSAETKIEFIGKGSFGCLLCPPIKLTEVNEVNEEISFKIPEFSFDNINNCNYVGKILATSLQNNSKDSYEEELYILKKIKDLDPNGYYTPKLIYANIHKGNDLLKSIQLLETIKPSKILNCVKEKIHKNVDYGYIILEHAGITIYNKYRKQSFDKNQLISLLNKFNKLFEFIKILYDKYYLHLDIKSDNITVKNNDDLCLIDFGRTTRLNKIEDYNKIIISYLWQNFIMYSFEPKIYSNLLLLFKKYEIKNYSFTKLKKYIKENFKILIKPYDFTTDDMKSFKDILVIVFETDFKNQSQFDNIVDYIYHRQEEYFFAYLDKREIYLNKYTKYDFDINELLYNIFYPIIEKTDIYCMGIVLSQVVIIYNKNYVKYNDIFKNRFENLIKSLLFNNFDYVDQIINEIINIINEIKKMDLLI